jgi:hypothetical protein
MNAPAGCVKKYSDVVYDRHDSTDGAIVDRYGQVDQKNFTTHSSLLEHKKNCEEQ